MWVPRLSVVLLLVRKATEKCKNVVWKASTQLKKSGMEVLKTLSGRLSDQLVKPFLPRTAQSPAASLL